MTIWFHAATVETFVPMLENMSRILEKAVVQASEKGWAHASLLEARLAPDMWPLVRQVQFTCWQAVNGSARLARTDPIQSEESETSFEELQARIDASIAFLHSIPAAAFDGAADRQVTYVIPDGRTFSMTGPAYLYHWLTPMFYFHVTTAYDILRHKGVDIGKMDFLQHSAYAMRHAETAS